MTRGGRGKGRGRRGRLNSSGRLVLENGLAATNEETPCDSCAKMFGEEDQMIQCEECLKWTCTKCADISDEQYKFVTEKDQLKGVWHEESFLCLYKSIVGQHLEYANQV